ncbi:MAG: glycine dehydrogenase (aminomethyl-transferring), partial [Pirellulaceae bacterium]
LERARAAGYNLRKLSERRIGIALDETTSEQDLQRLIAIFGGQEVAAEAPSSLAVEHWRSDRLLSQAVFHRYRSETEMMRYLRRLSEMDIALDRSMIPLGSCTMKLNAASELTPITWPEFNAIHPFAPPEQTAGYRELIRQLEAMLCAATGYD